MRRCLVDAESLLTVAVATLDTDGILVESNAGFLRLLPSPGEYPAGTQVAKFFVQPDFAALAQAAGAQDAEGYRGLLTIGDCAGASRTLRGRVWRTSAGIQLVAEYDIAELERLNQAMLDLSEESAVARQGLIRANFSLQQREAQSVETSLTDALTGVGNRRRLEQALVSEVSRVRRLGGTLSAIMADIDYFKRVNDGVGHAGGDKVLVRFGALLKAQCRATDIVARYGGEEFVLLLAHTSLAQAMTKAEKLRAAIAAETIGPLLQPVTCSFGVAELEHGEDGKSLVERADKALYQAKEGGRNQVVAAGAHAPAGEYLAKARPG